MFDLEPLDATFGAIVRNIDLRALDAATWDAFYQAWIEYGLLIVSGQYLTQKEQDDFARRFGQLEFAATAISNIDGKGRTRSAPDDDLVKSLRGNEDWHHDSSYMPVQAMGAVFSAEVVPKGGAPTGWADMRAAYEALDDATRERLAGLSAYHSLCYSQGRAGYLPTKTDGRRMYGYHDYEPSLRPLIKTHPVTGRPNLLIGRHAYGIPELGPDESEALIDQLNDAACQSPRVYYHRWEVGDLAVWDNRRLMHRGTPFDMTQPRRMWHTRIAGEPDADLAVNHR